MKFRVFDSFNHPNQIEFTIETVESNPNDDYLYGLLNYPNPFKDETAFVFHLLQDAEVEIEIYTVAGRKIKNLPPRYCQNGYVFDRFNWDGRDEQGDRIANGVYLYKVIADFNGESVSKIGRLIYMR
jgi:flagellar hook assembly protein FlgD